MSDSKSQIFITKHLSEKYDYLAPDGSEIRLLPAVRGGGLAHCTLPVGKVSKPVAHRTVEELWYCLSGEGEVWRSFGEYAVIVPVHTGISLTIPTGTRFQFRNSGDTPLCILIATMLPWPGEEEAVEVPDHQESQSV